MPHRTLPRTELERLDALESANRKLTALGPAGRRALRPGTQKRLATLLPSYRHAVRSRQALVGRQTEATAAVEATKAMLRLYVAHFLEALNRAIARGKDFRPGDRTHYGLAASQETLPRMRTLGEILQVAADVVRGEGERVGAGGKPITMPSVEEVAELLERLRALVLERKRIVAELDVFADAVSSLREPIDDLIRDIWDELDFAHRKEEAPARRRRLREWGVVFAVRTRLARDGVVGRGSDGVVERGSDGVVERGSGGVVERRSGGVVKSRSEWERVIEAEIGGNRVLDTQAEGRDEAIGGRCDDLSLTQKSNPISIGLTGRDRIAQGAGSS